MLIIIFFVYIKTLIFFTITQIQNTIFFQTRNSFIIRINPFFFCIFKYIKTSFTTLNSFFLHMNPIKNLRPIKIFRRTFSRRIFLLKKTIIHNYKLMIFLNVRI